MRRLNFQAGLSRQNRCQSTRFRDVRQYDRTARWTAPVQRHAPPKESDRREPHSALSALPALGAPRHGSGENPVVTGNSSAPIRPEGGTANRADSRQNDALRSPSRSGQTCNASCAIQGPEASTCPPRMPRRADSEQGLCKSARNGTPLHGVSPTMPVLDTSPY